VWLGVGTAVFISVALGAGMIGAFYGMKKNLFESTEGAWAGIFGLITALLITIMGAAMLRISKLQDKWKAKMTKALDHQQQHGHRLRTSTRIKIWSEKYAMFLIPFITVLREGLESVVFVGGVGVNEPPTSFPIAGLTGIGLGCLVGYLVYV